MPVFVRQGVIETGTRVDLRVAGLVRWVAEHTAYEPNRLFVDEQMTGPFRRWQHCVEFEDLGAGTRQHCEGRA